VSSHDLQSSLYSSDIILGNKVLYSVSNKINGIKIGLQLRGYPFKMSTKKSGF